MARESVSKTIDGEEYEFCQLGAMQSNRLLWKIKRIVGPSIIGMISSAQGEGLNAILGADVNLEEMANGFYERASEAEVDFVITKLLSQVMHTGAGTLDSDAKISAHFQGRLARMYKVLWEALKHEYSDFLEEGGIVDSLKSKADGIQKKQA